MNATERKGLHSLVDALPAREIPAARRFLEFLGQRSDLAGTNVRGTVEFFPADVEGLFTLDWAEAADG
jgi:hypothetical protein